MTKAADRGGYRGIDTWETQEIPLEDEIFGALQTLHLGRPVPAPLPNHWRLGFNHSACAPAADGERWRGAHPSPGLRAVVRRRRVGAAERATGAVARVRALARDSERNRRCFVSVGTGRMLTAAFESLAAAALRPGSWPRLARWVLDLVAIAKHGSLPRRLNVVLVVIIKALIYPQVTKAAMVATTHLVSSDKRVATRVASTGLIPTLIEALVDADKSVSEKALAVFDAVLTSEEGRASARGHALAMPVLVKKMFRVSDVATELCRRHRSLGSVKGGAGEPVRTVRRKPTMGTGR
uniref:U-box domain-containing protein n=1 Tax=Oryza glumipatula TaxID=40148 RepID=A0A0D9YFY8_9ORYZ